MDAIDPRAHLSLLVEASSGLKRKLTCSDSPGTRRARQTRSSAKHSSLNTGPVPALQPQAALLEHSHAPPVTRLRKRRFAVDGESINVPQPKRARLTRENLARFNNMTGADAKCHGDLPTEQTTNTKTSSSSSSFVFRIKQNGILFNSSKRPANFNDIHARISRSSDSVSLTEREFKRYKGRIKGAVNEQTILAATSWMLLKQYYRDENDENSDDDNPYCSAFSQQFTGFPQKAGFNDDVAAPQPDFVEGLVESQFEPFPLNAVSGALLFPLKKSSIALPHIAGEWKAYGGNMGQAENQSAYDGAALVYARTQALKYLGAEDTPGEAKVITFTTDGAYINLFAHYASPAENGGFKYHQYLIASHNLISSYDAFKAGLRMLRNAQDFAKEQSENLRDRLKEHGNNPPKLFDFEAEKEDHSPSSDDRSGHGPASRHNSRVHQSRQQRAAPTAGLPKRGRGRPPRQTASLSNGSRLVRAKATPITGSGKRGRGRPAQ